MHASAGIEPRGGQLVDLRIRLPSVTSSAVTITSKWRRRPTPTSIRSTSKRDADVPTARGMPSRASAMTNSRTPGTETMPARAKST
jgi:hypothetical protein